MQSQQRTFAIEVHVHEHDLPNFQTEVHTTAHVWGGRHVFLLGDPAQLPVIRQLWHHFMKKFTMLLLEWKPSNSHVWNNSTDEVELTRGLSSIPQGRGVV